MNATDIALEFVRRINDHSPDLLADLMTEGHTFIDSTGKRFEGRDLMRQGWKSYFSMIPDYKITVESGVENGDLAALFGTAQGTCAVNGVILVENRWEIPFAVRAVIASGKVQEWRVYADNHPVYEILGRHGR